MSCAAFTAIGVYVAATNKSNQWVVKVSFAAAILMFFVASYLAWSDQHTQLVQLSKRLESPQIKITVASSWWGSVVIQGQKRFVLILGVSVINPTGPPSALVDWAVRLRSREGNTFIGIQPILGPQTAINLPGKNHSLSLSIEKSLANVTSSVIPSGGLSGGWILVLFDGIETASFDSERMTVWLSTKDVVSGSEHQVAIPLGKENGVSLPGIGKLK
jgi:hypothetical protein